MREVIVKRCDKTADRFTVLLPGRAGPQELQLDRQDLNRRLREWSFGPQTIRTILNVPKGISLRFPFDGVRVTPDTTSAS